MREFVLGRGDFYRHPEFITVEESNFLRVHQEARQHDPQSYESGFIAMKCKPGAVHMFSDKDFHENMTQEEISRLDGIRDRIAVLMNSMRIGAQAFNYQGSPLFLRNTGFFTYRPGGCHLAHCDTDDPGRVVTIVLGLSDSQEYEGGRLTLYDQYAVDRSEASNFQEQMTELIHHPLMRTGTGGYTFYNEIMKDSFNATNSIQLGARELVAFLAENVHELQPVTSGTRRVMLQWMTSYKHLRDPRDVARESKQAPSAKQAGDSGEL